MYYYVYINFIQQEREINNNNISVWRDADDRVLDKYFIF